MALVKIEEIDLSLDFPEFDDYIGKVRENEVLVRVDKSGAFRELPKIDIMCFGFESQAIRFKMQKIEKDPVKRLADISFLVLTYLSKGSTVMFGKSWSLEQETRDKLSGLKSKYNISECDLTLPRITVSFPDIAVTLMNKLPNMARPIMLPELCKDMVDFPPELRGSYILAILNQESKNVKPRLPGVLAAVVHYKYKEGDLLNKKFKGLSKMEKIHDICHFVKKALNTAMRPMTAQLKAELIISNIEIETADAWVSAFKRLYDVNITDLICLK